MATLREVLEKYEGQNVKIGSQSGYMYCGPADASVVQNVSDVERQNILDRMCSYIDRIARTDELVEKEVGHKVSATIRKLWVLPNKDINVFSGTARKAAMDAMHSQMKERQDDVKKLRECMNRLSPWVGLLDREVLEVWNSIDEPGTKNIKVEGEESGKYWTTEEYQTGDIQEDEDE